MDPLVAAEDKSRDRRASKSSRHMNVAERGCRKMAGTPQAQG